ncbi:sulfotransferase [Cyanobium sp. BA20m-p-22]|uniref:sulfotransferase n=1 Tax=Cyanobium sp. BA20m-p-22 TaxID=2823704 RepID=UPI0020CC6D75|nr:sulfotransferase [Cyanobium sp. BA20m-p-22]MCP9910201.1 sulfotransferase [Cyanobium sp. BA20m-p-22]
MATLTPAAAGWFWWRQRTRALRWWPLRGELGRRGRRRWRRAHAVCLFLSPPRSGHSLLGALLDAHPDAAIGHELDALLFLRWGWRLVEVLPLLERSAQWAATQELLPGGYGYRLAGQGQVRQPLVVGDKHGEATLVELARRPWLRQRLELTSPAPLHWLRAVRHPLDNIATIAQKIDSIAAGVLPPGGTDLQRAEAYFFQLADWMDQGGGPQSRLLDVRHEDLLAEPERELGRLAGFLGLELDPAWLARCQAILRPAPHLSRREVCWEAGQQERILQRCGEYGFLSSYGPEEK